MLAKGGDDRTPADPATRLDFRILGPVEVVDGAGTALELGSRKQRAVLTLLVLNAPHVIPLDQLIDRLWADEPPSSATGTLQAYISQLRRILEPQRSPRSRAQVLRTREPGYLLDISPDQVDAHRFGRAVEAAQAALGAGRAPEAEQLLDAALTAWRGEPLADFADDPFAGPTVARLTEARLSALSLRAETWLALGRHAEAVVEAGHLLGLDPYREGFWALLMRALYRDRRQAEALAAYQRCRTLLSDELGLEPGPALRRLERAILDQDESLDRSPPESVTGPWPAQVQVTRVPQQEMYIPTVPADPADHVAAGPSGPVAHGAAGGGETHQSVLAECRRRLVGREPHLRRIRERLDATVRGVGGVLLVSGESGIGKTRLADAAARIAEETGVTVVWSRCVEGSGAPAFWPWIQALNALGGGTGGDGGDGELAGVTRRLTGGDEAPGAGDPDTARFLLYDAVSGALSRRVAAAPVLLLMEDIHWADAASLKLLTFLGADLHRVPLLVLATLRPEPAQARQALTDALGDLTRQRGTERMSVTALTAEQVADHLHDVDPALAHALHDRTGGNPFFLGELLRLLTSVSPLQRLSVADVTSIAVPDGVRDVITRRVSRLPEDSQTLLRVAAVIGRDVDADVLDAATGVGATRMMMLLEPAVAIGLLTEVDGGWDYRFSHALVQEALYEGLSRLQRAQIHGRVGEAIENLHPGDLDVRLPVLAHHFGMAARVGEAAKATSYASRAAVQAAARLAYDEAVMFWEQALAALAPHAPESAASRTALLIELGRARRVTGDVTGARVALDEAVTLASRRGDDAAVIEAATVFGGVTLWNWRAYGVVDARMVAVLEEQLDRLPPGDDTRRAELLGTLGVELYYSDRRDEGRRHATEAVALARKTGDHRLLARTLNNFVIAAWTPEYEEDRYLAAEEILTLPDLPRAAEIIARLHRMPTLLRSGLLTDYDTELACCLRLTGEVRMPEIETQVTYAAVGRAMLDGRWEDVERLAGVAAESYRLTSLWGPDCINLICTFLANRAQGRHGVLLPELVDAAGNDSYRLLRPTAVLAAVEAGDEPLAHRLIDWWGAVAEHDWTWQFVVWQWALVAARIGRPDPRGLLAELAPITDQLVTLGTGCASWGSLNEATARLLHRIGRTEEALTHAERARETHRRLGLPYLERQSAALVESIRGSGTSGPLNG
ncbi:DNA-binding SARP family transcriptional activator [Streptosporangium becharense]|uniref:DNA-binding SARP family transcriptional activator n=1 Tax=Streptosporangium becharense TaxID=1816182 RepID=A0A7W9IFW0_9ACTN|nr:BTAD domain-containing putative transcriptional regulator [Streptosporangium becharense]MBB2909079.1 DNA-binding SARP family transcriptional activator [Streptosporangium becharense]MBB5819903.1 DNA-binding SARP family transcriptional activator [Streptosporangium becharense]